MTATEAVTVGSGEPSAERIGRDAPCLAVPTLAEHRVREAIAAVASGRPVVVVDDADRENEGDLIFAAACATPELVAFMVRHTSGFLCVALPGSECDRLALPPMHHRTGDRFHTAYRVTVDVRGSGTGISAIARAKTIAALGSAASVAEDFVRPGHVVPLLAQPAGVLSRPGHTEAAVDLARLAGRPEAGALCEIVSRERLGEMARGDELVRFAAEHDLVLISVADLIAYRQRTEPQVRRAVTTSLPTEHGTFKAVGYEGLHDGAEHLALVTGAIDDGRPVPVHVHTECLTGDVLRSTACGCRQALDEAMASFSAEGRGAVVYLRPAERARACHLLSGDEVTGLAGTAEWILADLGVQSIRTTTGSLPNRIGERSPARRRHPAIPSRIAG